MIGVDCELLYDVVEDKDGIAVGDYREDTTVLTGVVLAEAFLTF